MRSSGNISLTADGEVIGVRKKRSEVHSLQAVQREPHAISPHEIRATYNEWLNSARQHELQLHKSLKSKSVQEQHRDLGFKHTPPKPELKSQIRSPDKPVREPLRVELRRVNDSAAHWQRAPSPKMGAPISANRMGPATPGPGAYAIPSAFA